MKHPKTIARELALQYLYMHDVLYRRGVTSLSDFVCEHDGDFSDESITFARLLVNHVIANLEKIDHEISSVSSNWKLNRMSIVDRNILRIGLAELSSNPDTPYRVVLNEAIELARSFSSKSSCAFVNGVLDNLRMRL